MMNDKKEQPYNSVSYRSVKLLGKKERKNEKKRKFRDKFCLKKRFINNKIEYLNFWVKEYLVGS